MNQSKIKEKNKKWISPHVISILVASLLRNLWKGKGVKTKILWGGVLKIGERKFRAD